MFNEEVGSDYTAVRTFYIQSYLTDGDEISYRCSTLTFTSNEFYIMSINETRN
jgi:hypothetical protein